MMECLPRDMTKMTSQRKGQFLINYIRLTEDYPVWDDKLAFAKNMRIKSAFIEKFIYNISTVEFNKIMNMWKSQK